MRHDDPRGSRTWCRYECSCESAPRIERYIERKIEKIEIHREKKEEKKDREERHIGAIRRRISDRAPTRRRISDK